MTHRRVGYIRTSPADDGDSPPLPCVPADCTYRENVSSKDHRRPQRRAALAAVQAGDTLVCHSMRRIARNMEELRELLTDASGRGVAVEFVEEGMVFAPYMAAESLEREVSLIAAGAGFVRGLDAERQRIGIKKATAKKRTYNGAPMKITGADLARLRMRLRGLKTNPNDSIAKMARDFHVSRETIYRYEKAELGLALANERAQRAKRQRSRDPEKAARTAKDAIVKRRAANAAAKGLPIEEARARRELDDQRREAVGRLPLRSRRPTRGDDSGG